MILSIQVVRDSEFCQYEKKKILTKFLSLVPEAANWCGERSNYPGYDLMTENITISQNFTQCQFQCELLENCQYVTFDTETLECMFKNGKNSSKPSITLISGPQICGNF